MSDTHEIETHGVRMPNGRHAGERITRVPQSYLRWMIRANHQLADTAQAELERRGSRMPPIEASSHAIDRASQRCLKVWKQTRDGDEGLCTWLCRLGAEALAKAEGAETTHYAGMRWTFKYDGGWPVIVTVARLNRNTPSRQGVERIERQKGKRRKPKPEPEPVKGGLDA